MALKKIASVKSKTRTHWVGDGFPVQSLFSYHDQGEAISPFLLLDYAAPSHFEPADRPRGVETHPHRGFETVTIVYQGELEHKDSAGNAGRIGPGDVQWMTAGRGILHEEMHGRDFTSKGGVFQVAQLWVNLPAASKMTPPRYQELVSAAIPVVNGDGVVVRVIAGDYNGTAGAAKTFTPVNLWDVRLKAGAKARLPLPDGHTAMLLVLKGAIVGDGETAKESELVQFTRDGDGIELEAAEESTLLVMSGEPIDEPIAGYGPFVMNTQEEIRTAIEDFRAGRF